jgi:hypothetical protein
VFSRILTDEERKLLEAFLSEGAKPRGIGTRMWRIRRFTPQIEADLKLMGKALAKYDRTKTK